MADPSDALHVAGDESVRALSQPTTLRVFLALTDAPVTEEALSLELRIPRPELAMRLAALEDAGLVAVAPAGPEPSAPRYLSARHPHLRHSLGDTPGAVAMRRGMLQVAQTLVAEGERALEARGGAARAGIGVITLPDEPDALLEAARILADAENKLRALSRETVRPSGGADVRIALLILPAP